MFKWILGGFLVLLAMIVCGYFGTIYAANQAPNFQFLGQVGYEAGGTLGGLVGLGLGLGGLLAIFVVRRLSHASAT
jgi:hypothetical protein